MADQISAGTLDAPSWDVISTAKVAASIYAPLGTDMTLGDYVRVVKVFVEGFKKTGKGWNQGSKSIWAELGADPSSPGVDTRGDPIVSAERKREDAQRHDQAVDLLAQDLKVFDSQLAAEGRPSRFSRSITTDSCS
jgi:glycerol-3-phosphate O-acyltransferase / dihydroxyacetone phosphate acyltransferase